MTREEAINELSMAIDLIKQDGKDWLDERDVPILEMAIETLTEQEKGKWIWQTCDIYRCSECNVDVHIAERMGESIYNWCPYCGADMRDHVLNYADNDIAQSGLASAT